MRYYNSKIYNFLVRHIVELISPENNTVRIISFYKQSDYVNVYFLVDGILNKYVISENRSNLDLYIEYFNKLDNEYYSFIEFEEEVYRTIDGELVYMPYKHVSGNCVYFIILNRDTHIINHSHNDYHIENFDKFYKRDYTNKNFGLLDGL